MFSTGNHSPDETRIDLVDPFRKTVYKEYLAYCSNRLEIEAVEITNFYEIWRVLFPDIRTSKFVDLPGHCDTCYHIGIMIAFIIIYIIIYLHSVARSLLTVI